MHHAGKKVSSIAVVLSMLAVLGIATASSAMAAECFGRNANVVGTSGADTILIDEQDGQIIATVNGVTQVIRGTVVIASLGGDDQVDVNLSQSETGVRVFACLGAGMDNFNSTDSNKAPVFVNGNGGVDTIQGGGGNDTLKGGTGDDVINGGSGSADRCSSPNPAPNQGCE